MMQLNSVLTKSFGHYSIPSPSAHAPPGPLSTPSIPESLLLSLAWEASDSFIGVYG